MNRMKFSITDQERINKIREESLSKIKNHPSLIDFIFKNNLSDEIILSNASKFIRFIEGNEKCIDCPGLSKCPNNLRGIKFGLSYEDDETIELLFCPCEENKNKLDLDSKYIVRDFEDEILKYSFKDLLNPDYIMVRKDAISMMRDILNKSINKGIYLYGSRASGKSFMLSVFSKVCVEKGFGNVAYFNCSTKLKELNDLYFVNKEVFNIRLKELMEVDVLILDDFGNEYKTEPLRDIVVYPLLNERYRSQKLTCFTSSYDLKQIEQMYSLKDKGSPKANQLVELILLLSKEIKINSLPYRE